jgi:hypothetical protein
LLAQVTPAITNRCMLKLSTTKKWDILKVSFSKSCSGGDGGCEPCTDDVCDLPNDPEGGGVAACVDPDLDPVCDVAVEALFVTETFSERSRDCCPAWRRLSMGPAFTLSVILSKYTRRLRNTSYVVGQYL